MLQVILTFGMSDTTFYFLKEASKKREFQVIVAEGTWHYFQMLDQRRISFSFHRSRFLNGFFSPCFVFREPGCPRYDGHLMAKKLSDSGIQTTLIADSAVFAMMARANKVFLPCHAVRAKH